MLLSKISSGNMKRKWTNWITVTGALICATLFDFINRMLPDHSPVALIRTTIAFVDGIFQHTHL